jgi:hypothetical protein
MNPDPDSLNLDPDTDLDPAFQVNPDPDKEPDPDADPIRIQGLMRKTKEKNTIENLFKSFFQRSKENIEHH